MSNWVMRYYSGGLTVDDGGSTPPLCDANGNIKVVIGAAGTLPAGAATSVKQDTGNTSLASIASGTGIVAAASFTPAAAAYVANDVMGTTPVQSFTFTYAGSGLAIPNTSLIRVLTAIVRIDQTALQVSEGAYQLQGYNVTPPSAQADNDAWTLASADLTAYRGAIALGTPADLGAACYVKSPNIDLDIRLTTGVLFAELQTLAGFTATAVARQVTLYGIIL